MTGFIPTTIHPSEKTKTFLEEQCLIIKNNKEERLYHGFWRTGLESTWKFYSTLFKYFNQHNISSITEYTSALTIVIKTTKMIDQAASAKLGILNVTGLIDIKQTDETNGRGRFKVTISLGPNAWALENNKALISFTKEHMLLRQKPLLQFVRYKSAPKKRNAHYSKTEVDSEPSSLPEPKQEITTLSTVPPNNLPTLFATAERIHADFKELERRLELRKPNNPKQYYHDCRLIEHLKGEFSALMVQVLPEKDEEALVSKTVKLENPGELLQLTDQLKST